MTDSSALHSALLKPAILHILRATGFHSTKPSVLDTLTDLSERFIQLLAQRTAEAAYDRTALAHARFALAASGKNDDYTPRPYHEGPSIPPDLGSIQPILADVIIALSATNVFATSLTPSEEAWRERLRRPLSGFPAGAAREKERRRRDAEDAREVRDFVDWCMGPVAAEARRIAGLELREEVLSGRPVAATAVAGPEDMTDVGPTATEVETRIEKTRPDDYLSTLKKKYSRTGDGARYAGTVLGSKRALEQGLPAHGTNSSGILRIDGGPPSLQEWRREMSKRRAGYEQSQEREAG